MNLLNRNTRFTILLVAIIFLFLSGCATLSNNVYIETKPGFNDRDIKRIGIVKFENRSLDPNAGFKVADFFYQELSSYDHFELINPTAMSEGFGMEFVKMPEGVAGLPQQAIGGAKAVESDKIEVDVGKSPDLDAIVTGVITRYDDKDGSSISVNSPASVSFKVYLIRVEDNKVLWSANFAETQQALFDNLLLADRFKQAGGVWLNSDSLTELAMQRVMKAFPGLSTEKSKIVVK